ncbi:hypothetical protein FJC65_26500, partial [Escherichia coli]|nr:hypothetical protein [Escherichia coli]
MCGSLGVGCGFVGHEGMLFLVLGLESPVLSPLLVGGGVPGGRSSGDFFYVCPCPRISYLG